MYLILLDRFVKRGTADSRIMVPFDHSSQAVGMDWPLCLVLRSRYGWQEDQDIKYDPRHKCSDVEHRDRPSIPRDVVR